MNVKNDKYGLGEEWDWDSFSLSALEAMRKVQLTHPGKMPNPYSRDPQERKDALFMKDFEYALRMARRKHFASVVEMSRAITKRVADRGGREPNLNSTDRQEREDARWLAQRGFSIKDCI